MKRKRENDDYFQNFRNSTTASSYSQPPKKKRKREIKKLNLEFEDSNGSLSILTPKKTIWHSIYVQNVPTTERDKNYFRKRFRLTFDAYLQIFIDMKESPLFTRGGKTNGFGDCPAPLELLLL